ncbi:MAG: hypothetical protein HN820_05220 [Candidatus Marinimicrobia bacterium]|nr:hypothetical protein [Candidatus Neomarinimicrobiota bacterium]
MMTIRKISINLLLGFLFSAWLVGAPNSDAHIEIISESNAELHLQYNFENLNLHEIIINGEQYIQPQLMGMVHNQIKSMPDLPSLSTSIQIPIGKKAIFNIEVSNIEVFNKTDIPPSKGKMTRNIDPQDVDYTFNDMYKLDSNFPTKMVKIDSPLIFRGIKGNTINIVPFAYNPFQSTLTFYSTIDVHIQFVDDRIGTAPIQSKLTNPFTQVMDRFFINSSSSRYENIEDNGALVIITDDAYITPLQPLVDWKNMRGLHTQVHTTQLIGNTPELIKTFISEKYIEENISYVLLVGNTDQVSTFWPEPTIPSDPMYGYLDGDDAYPEVFVGRFSANSIDDVQIQVERVIRYERDMTSQAIWYNEGIGIASSQGDGQGDDGESDDVHMEIIREKLINYNYTNIDQAYDIYGTTPQQVYDAVNEGRGIINYAGHGSLNSWISSGFSIADINSLENVDRYPFIISVSCYTGASQFDLSMAETWLRANNSGNPTGAIAVAASSTLMQWAPPMECQDEFNDILTESYNDNQIFSFGGIFYNSTLKMIESYGDNGVQEAKFWHVYGDPSVMIRTDVPTTISANYSDVITIGQNSLNISVDQNGVVGTLSKNGELLTSNVAINGLISLPLSSVDLQIGMYDLVISGYNSVTHISEIEMIMPESGFMAINNISFNGENGSNHVNNGEDVLVSIDASNIGINELSSVQFELITEDVFILDFTESLSFENIIVNENILGELSFHVRNDTPDNHNAQVNLLITSGETQWVHPFVVEVNSPEIMISTSILTEDNEDGIWDLGEAATLSFVLSNIGSGSMNFPIQLNVEMDNSLALDLNDGYTIETLSFEDIHPVFLHFLSATDIPLGSELSIHIQLIELGCEEYCRELPELNLQFSIGNAPVLIWNPSLSSSSSTRLANYLMGQGFGSYDHIISEEIPNTANYHSAFVFLGIYPENYQLTQADAGAIVNILNRGGNVYLEGGDTWVFNEATDLHPYFHIQGISDGSADLISISGGENTFADGMTFTYEGAVNWIDRIAPLDGAQSLLNNVDPEYTTAVIYEDSSGYKTIGTSHELGGLTGDQFPDYVNGMINFFNFDAQDICSIGDINNDGMINILDVVRVVSIILNNGPQETVQEICASDINGDGDLNVMDVVLLVQGILQPNQ